MSNRKLLIRGRDAIVFMICITAAAFIIISNAHEFNKLLVFLPVVFGLCYVIVLAPLRNRTGSKTVFWFTVAEFIRLVFVPCYEAINDYVGFYGFSTQDTSLLLRSIVLMSYECVFVSIFLALALRNTVKVEGEEETEVEPLGNDAVALGIVLLMGYQRNLALFSLKITIRLLRIVHRWYKVFPVITPFQQSTICR